MRPAPCEQRRRRTLQHVAGFVGRIRGLRMRHSVAESSEDQYSKPTRQEKMSIWSSLELVKTGLVGRMMNVRRMGRILEIAQSMRRTRGRISNPRLSAGGLDVIKPTSAQWPTTAASPQVRVSYDLGKVVTQRIAAELSGNTFPRTPRGDRKVSPSGV